MFFSAILSYALALTMLSKPYVGLPWPALETRLTLLRFPSVETCQYRLDRSQRHLDWIDERMLLFWRDRAELLRYRQQVAAWREVWEALRTAQRWPYTRQDEERMKRVREAIGEDSWRRGHVPPPIASYFLDVLSSAR